MATEFSRVITLLRKERGITQKKAASELGISQALLSHYERGIRECGLEFVIKTADYYGVSCDYLLGRSAERSGLTLHVEDIPAPEANSGADGQYKGSVLPTLNRKLLSNSLIILFDKLNACPDKNLVNEISGFLMMSVYHMFRLVYSAGPKNAPSLFSVSEPVWRGYNHAAMHTTSANVDAILQGATPVGGDAIDSADLKGFMMTTESLAEDYPLYATSLLNLIKASEERIDQATNLP